MPRQTTDISEIEGARYECDNCHEVDHLPVTAIGTIDQAARVVGWRMGPDAKPLYCPDCAGTDSSYWARKRRDVALELVEQIGGF